MEKGAIIGAIVAFVIIIGLALSGLFFNKINCEDELDCFEKYYDSCKEYTITHDIDNVVVEFNEGVITEIKILGHSYSDKCEVSFKILTVENYSDSWAINKEMICSLSKEDFEIEGDEKILKTQCQGSLATSIISNCSYSNEEYDCSKERIVPVEIFVNSTIDPENLCKRANGDYEPDVIDCLNTLKIVYEAFEQEGISICGTLHYSSSKKMCEEAVNNYSNYNAWYFSIVSEYTEKGYI